MDMENSVVITRGREREGRWSIVEGRLMVIDGDLTQGSGHTMPCTDVECCRIVHLQPL